MESGMMRLLLRLSIFMVIVVKAEKNETGQTDVDEIEYFDENGMNMTGQEMFCLDKSEQLNATKHRGFFHGFCMAKCPDSLS